MHIILGNTLPKSFALMPAFDSRQSLIGALEVERALVGEVRTEVPRRAVWRGEVGADSCDVLAWLGALERRDGSVGDDARGRACHVDVVDVGDGERRRELGASVRSASNSPSPG